MAKKTVEELAADVDAILLKVKSVEEANTQLSADNKALNEKNTELEGKVSELSSKVDTFQSSVTEAKEASAAAKEASEAAKQSSDSAHELVVEINDNIQKLEGTLNQAIEEKGKGIVTSLGKETAKPKPTIPENGVKVKYKRNGKDTTGTFKLLVPTINVNGAVMTAEECLENADAMTFLVEETLKNGKSPFVVEVH